MGRKTKELDIAGTTINIGHDALARLCSEIESYNRKDIFLLADYNTAGYCIPKLIKWIPALADAKRIVIEPGEENKTIQTCEEVWTQLASTGANRSSLLINIGGGVITDLGGFIASTFHRGMAFINVPTTLMAMIDAALGGKTGVDLSSLKNMVGLIVNPQAVYVWPEFLTTLPHRYMLSGYAEMLKHALIADQDFWKLLIKKPMALIGDWEELIFRAALIKAEIVNNDPQEKGKRRVLNFGHTIGHAFETYSLRHDDHPLSHGEAIAMGIICETYISYRILELPYSARDIIIKNILLNFNHYKIDTKAIDELIELVMLDKKNRSGNVLMTLLKDIGYAVEGQVCNTEIIRESLFRYSDFKGLKD